MIREIARAAWAESPARTIVAILATPVVVVLGWALLVGVIVAGQP